jgi:hypothetical protein
VSHHLLRVRGSAKPADIVFVRCASGGSRCRVTRRLLCRRASGSCSDLQLEFAQAFARAPAHFACPRARHSSRGLRDLHPRTTYAYRVSRDPWRSHLCGDAHPRVSIPFRCTFKRIDFLPFVVCHQTLTTRSASGRLEAFAQKAPRGLSRSCLWTEWLCESTRRLSTRRVATAHKVLRALSITKCH